MATDEGKSIPEDSEMAECDGDKVVTMMDVLQEQQDFEEDANAVLGASDDRNCTYAKGYIKRQAIYACLTCCPDAKMDPTKRAGVCLACSLNCHENHDLIELYTKRNFRCDCGNPKFNSLPCQYTSNKNDLNIDNIYNQNFSGLYCICQRPYPDPDNDCEDDMIQCIICEDWLHASHLDAVVPATQYSEMICKGCMDKNEFLHDYGNLAVNVETVDVLTVNGNHTDGHNVCNGDATSSDDKEVVTNGGDVSMAKDNDKKTSSEDSKEVQHEGKDELQTRNEEPKTAKDNIVDYKTETADNTNEQQQSSTTVETIQSENVDKIKDDTAQKDKDFDEQKEDTSNCTSETSESINEQDNTAKSLDKSSSAVTENTENVSKEPINEFNVNSEAPQKSSVKENSDDKTDEVMNAIDAILEYTDTEGSGQKEINESPSVETNTKEGVTQESNNVDMANSEAKQNDIVPEKVEMSTTESDKKTDNDVEMTDKLHTKASTVENGVDTEAKESTDVAVNDESTKLVEGEMVNESLTEDTNKETDNTDGTEKEEMSKTDSIADEVCDSAKENKRKLSTTEESSPKKVKLDASKCTRPKDVKRVHKGATFWPSNFRQKLCSCGECISMYKDLKLIYLTDLEDTVAFYESLGKEKLDGIVSQYEKGLQALSSLDRIHQINALTEYNNMRDKLLEYLKAFKDRRVIVKEEDIKAFFAGMKPRREHDGVYFCG